jgi:hypothetical protein
MPRPTTKSARPLSGKAASSFDLAAWTRSYVPHGGARGCSTCVRAPNVLKPIDVVLAEVKKGATFPGFAPLRRMLEEQFGYQLSTSALKIHLRKCRGFGTADH